MNSDNLKHLRNDYAEGELNLQMLDPDPFKQFAKWLELAMATSEEIEANAMVLATVDAEKQPSARVVLLKEVTEHGFVFYTNYSSRKGEELARNPKCATTFWWHRIQCQVRIEGTVEKVSEQDATEYFLSRPIGSQWGAIVSPQSQVIPDRDFLVRRLETEKAAHTNSEEGLEKPSQWGGYVIKPNAFEFWQGRENRLHDRFRYLRKGEVWQIDRLAP